MGLCVAAARESVFVVVAPDLLGDAPFEETRRDGDGIFDVHP